MTATTSPSLSLPGRAAMLASTFVFAAYFSLLHVLIVRGIAPMLCIALIVGPWIATLGIAVWSRPGSTATKAIATFVAVLVAASLAWRFGDRIADRVDVVLYLENLTFLIGLCALFALSLAPGREPLITRLARRARDGRLPSTALRYTRHVTTAWAVFFATMAMTSTVLFTTQSRTVWSTFVNLLIWPAMVAMFALEYAVRIRVLRDIPHVPMMRGVHAFRQRDAIAPIESRSEHR